LAAFRRFRALHKRLGTKKLARATGLSESTVRRGLRDKTLSERSSGKLDRYLERQYAREERRAIRAEIPQTIPSYSAQKWARVLGDIRALRGENSIAHQRVKHAIKEIQGRGLAVDAALEADQHRYQRLDENLSKLERDIKPTDTLEERLHRVQNIDNEHKIIARKYGLTARAVYSLYYSPPSYGR
jgi:AraC-like DNA-binding protein